LGGYKTKGRKEKQEVMIPEANVKNLMLRKNVVKAVEERRFAIYRVITVEQGIEILTGVPSGTADKKGSYPKDTVYGKFQRRLKDYLKRAIELKAGAKPDPE
jgi:predicted ATP-dependent protease